MDARYKLEKLLSDYVLQTLGFIRTVRSFCDKEQEPTFLSVEMEKMKDIKSRADKISPTFDDVKKAENSFAKFGKFLWNSIVSPVSEYQELEKELDATLKDTLDGLEKLAPFLDAIEKLAVTSHFVFMEESFLPKGESPASVRAVITAAKEVSPLLIQFKLNAQTFFLPVLNNIDVLISHLDKYIRITQQLCEKLAKRARSVLWSGDIYKWKEKEFKPIISANLCDDSIQKMRDHLYLISMIRVDQHFRITFLFQDRAQHFIGIFSQRCSRMEAFLSDLEKSAVKLDKMKKGASISTVAGSSVGVAGGVLYLAGLALAPVTAGVSLVLTVTGVSLGVTSGVNSLVTDITEFKVNRYHGKNAQDILLQYYIDVEEVQNCLDQASNEKRLELASESLAIVALNAAASFKAVVDDVDSIADATLAIKVLKTKTVAASAVKMGLQKAQSGHAVPKLAADLPDIGQIAKGTPLALSKGARAGFITLSAFSIFFGVLSICKNSISLAKGSKSETSQRIRSRSELWKSELESWKEIHYSLSKGIRKFEMNPEALEQNFLSQTSVCDE